MTPVYTVCVLVFFSLQMQLFLIQCTLQIGLTTFFLRSLNSHIQNLQRDGKVRLKYVCLCHVGWCALNLLVVALIVTNPRLQKM